MKKRVFWILAFLPAIFCLEANAQSYDEERVLMRQLSDTSQVVRDTAAARMRRLVAEGRNTDGVGHMQEHDLATWQAKFAKINMRGTLAEVKKAMKVKDKPNNFDFCDDFGFSCSWSHRLDSSHVILLRYDPKPPHKVVHDTVLQSQVYIRVNRQPNFTGTWTTYWLNGQKHQSCDYVNGMAHGIYSCFYPDGQLQSISHYVKNHQESDSRMFHPNGNVAQSCTYLNGQLEGEVAEYYPDGVLKSRRTYLHGHIVGTEQQFYPDGKPKWESMFDEKGNRMWSKGWDEEGKLVHDEGPMIIDLEED